MVHNSSNCSSFLEVTSNGLFLRYGKKLRSFIYYFSEITKNNINTLNIMSTEAVALRCSVKKGFLKICKIHMQTSELESLFQ